MKPGRTWRNVQDTATASQILRGSTHAWANWRRGQDYYEEGALIWLDADTTIRQLTHDKKSLNDFCFKFLAVGGNTPPAVVPYTFDEIVTDLNSVVAYDWRAFLTERLQTHADHAPLNGIEHGGYRLVYTTEPTEYEVAHLDHYKQIDAWFSLGLTALLDGTTRRCTGGLPCLPGRSWAWDQTGRSQRAWLQCRRVETSVARR